MPNIDEDSTEAAKLLAKRNEGRGRAYRVDSAATAQKVQIHGFGESESEDRTVTPVDSEQLEDLDGKMATVVAARFSNDDDPPNGDVDDYPERPKKLFDEAQGGIVEMATMIADPNLKRSESSELLHLNLHQVRI